MFNCGLYFTTSITSMILIVIFNYKLFDPLFKLNINKQHDTI